MAEQRQMFPDLPPGTGPIVKVKSLARPLWTEHKAKLIARYLRYFVFITKHGNYIDGFAGPQREKKEGAEDMWSARLVMMSTPRRLRKFFLCDIATDQVAALESLVEQDKEVTAALRRQGERTEKRSYHAVSGDFNKTVDDFLASGKILPKEATFALLDQRSLECSWETVEKLARYCKPPHNKIELFYFLATGWLPRTISANKDHPERMDAWWGHSGWKQFCGQRGEKWAEEVVRRLKEDLGYKHVMAWPIRERERARGRTMYYMIHTSDHPEAPKLMYRAYNYVLAPIETGEQLGLALGDGGLCTDEISE